MSESEQTPVRESPALHRCLCQLVHEDDPSSLKDRCAAWSDIPDSPLCRDCLNAGHGDLPHVPYIETRRQWAEFDKRAAERRARQS